MSPFNCRSFVCWVGQSGFAKGNRKGAECPHLEYLFSNSHPLISLSLLFTLTVNKYLKECQISSSLRIRNHSFSWDSLMPIWPWAKARAHIKTHLPESQCHPVKEQQSGANRFAASSSSIWNFSLSFLHIYLSILYLHFKIQLKCISSSKLFLELIHPFCVYS